MASVMKQTPPENIYAHLAESSDDEDGGTVATRREPTVVRDQGAKAAPQRPPRELPMGAQNQIHAARGESSVRGGAQRGRGRGPRGGGFSSPVMADEGGGRAIDEDSRMGPRGRGGRGFGVRRGAGGGVTRHREADRHVSGTGRGRAIKKGGGGGHNWGVPAEDEEHNATPVNAAVPEGNASGEVVSGWDTTMAEPEAAGEVQNQVAEETDVRAPEPEMIDVHEFMKRKALMRATLPTLPSVEVRQRSKAAQEDLLKEGYELHVKAQDIESRAMSRPDKASDHRAGRSSQMNSEFFAPPPRPRGRGRGRPGAKPAEANGSPVVDAPSQRLPAKLDLSDNHAFPGLI